MQVDSGEPADVAPSYARGKPRVPGRGTGDKIPALLTPGEAVLTKRAAEKVGRSKIAAMNKSSQAGEAQERPGRSRGVLDGSNSAGLSGLEASMHAHADREHPVKACFGSSAIR